MPLIFSDTDQDKLDQLSQAWARMVDCITHDLITPLVTIRMSTESLRNIFPDLMKGYQLAVKNNLIESDINEKRLKLIEDNVFAGNKNITTNVISFLRLLHPFNQKLFSDSEAIQVLSVQACIEQLLKNYPFADENERSLVHVNCPHDFKFSCAPIFIEQLFLNLLSNALDYIKQTGRGAIKIWTEEEADYHALYFKDTAQGMDEHTLACVFNRFFSKRDEVIVPGLGFCRLAVLQRGGDVLCRSEKGKYTEFVVKFPKRD